MESLLALVRLGQDWAKTGNETDGAEKLSELNAPPLHPTAPVHARSLFSHAARPGHARPLMTEAPQPVEIASG